MSLKQEHKTIEAMIRLYCRKHHQSAGLCDACRELFDYATKRLNACRYGEEKPTCRNCPIHCYRPEMRSRVAEVMRYAGPRLLFRHPLLALLHLYKDKKSKRLD